MFKNKEDKRHDAIHETNIKRGITSHFARTLKILQQKHMQRDGDGFIYSNDYSNNLCNALEAVFLHGLKDSVTQKLSSLISGPPNTDSVASLNFWNVVTKFTHGDVIAQLKSLAQISTDVGLCRAWVRLALNDGLIESYLLSMVVDEKTLKYNYHPYAFLRDHEQPGILKNYMTGLMSLELHLSFNSSVLNDWNNSTLQLAGVLVSTSTPPPAINDLPPTAHSTPTVISEPRDLLALAENAPDVIEYSPIVRKKKEKDEPIVVKKKALKKQDYPDETSQSMFTSIKDTEEIRRKRASRIPDMAFSPSENSTSSYISCPEDEMKSDDENNQYDESNLNFDFGKDLESNSNIKPDMFSSKSKPTIVPLSQARFKTRLSGSPVIVDPAASHEEMLNSPRRPRSRRVNMADLDKLSLRVKNSWTFSDSVSSRDFFSENIEEGYNEGDQESNKVNSFNPQSPDSASTSYTEPSIYDTKPLRNYEDLCADLPPIEMGSAEQDAVLKKVLQEKDIKDRLEKARKTTKKQKKEKAEISVTDTKETSDTKALQVNENKKVLSDAVGQKLSDSGDENILESDDTVVSLITVTDHFDNEADDKTRRVSNSNPVNVEILKNEENDEPANSGFGNSLGNSLGNMIGWSSELESTIEDTDKDRAESFATMLKTYQTSADSPATGTTIDEVIQSLAPESDFTLLKEDQDEEFQQDEDSCLNDFVVLDSPCDTMPGRLLQDSSRMIYVFRVPQENGLSQQNYTCRGCSRNIGIIYGPPRLCEFDGGLYCFECHENNETIIPSSVIYNWDLSKKKVCVKNFKFLQDIEDQPLYDIEELNPRLYSHVSELNDLKCMREKLCFLKSYMFTCSEKNADSLRQKIWPREHLYERKDIYSLVDLGQVMSGSLLKVLKEVSKFASTHVYDCPLCSQKGFVCEICGNPKVIYPFEVDTTIRCKTCKSVFHKTCLSENMPCPKCERWSRRISRPNLQNDHPEDYGMSPNY